MLQHVFICMSLLSKHCLLSLFLWNGRSPSCRVRLLALEQRVPRDCNRNLMAFLIDHRITEWPSYNETTQMPYILYWSHAIMSASLPTKLSLRSYTISRTLSYKQLHGVLFTVLYLSK